MDEKAGGRPSSRGTVSRRRLTEVARVLVTHPGRQHSHELALALHERGCLVGYWTGVPAHRRPAPPVLGRVVAYRSRYDFLPLPPAAVRHCFIAPTVHRVARSLLRPPQAVSVAHRAQALFDCWCSRRLRDIDTDAVVCYENAALKTFRHARARGIVTILDAASFHHVRQDQFQEPVERSIAHDRITRRKDAEVALADHVLTASELARRSYLDAGVAPERVTAVPLGCDLDRFRPRGFRNDAQPVTFVFAGRGERQKGFDVLITAARKLSEEDQCFSLQVAGPVASDLVPRDVQQVEFLGRLSQQHLARVYREGDVLVLPSRYDSFGMVVPEAMASGLPVIVSDHVGAKSLVEEAVTGWIVPAGNARALADRMREAVLNPERTFAMGRRAVETARDYGWETYRERVTAVIVDVVERRVDSRQVRS